MRNKAFLVFPLLLWVLAGCRQIDEPYMHNDFLMGTWCSVTLYEESPEAMEAVFDRLAAIEERMSRNLPDSEVSRINLQAGGGPVPVSEDTLLVLQTALEMAEWSGGAYDPTAGPLVDLWAIGTEEAGVPDEEDLNAALALVDFRKVEVDVEAGTVRLPSAGMSLDLGGIAKGYAADEAARILGEYGIRRAIINLGGNTFVLGMKSEEESWMIGLQIPGDSRGRYFSVLPVQGASVVTSGGYERYFEVDGVRYHHLLNTESGYPEENGLLSVSILSPSSIHADGLSTAVFILGREDGSELIEQLPGMEALFLLDDQTIAVTSGWPSPVNLVEGYRHIP